MKTYMANPDKIERKWYVVDAECSEEKINRSTHRTLIQEIM